MWCVRLPIMDKGCFCLLDNVNNVVNNVGLQISSLVPLDPLAGGNEVSVSSGKSRLIF